MGRTTPGLVLPDWLRKVFTSKTPKFPPPPNAENVNPPPIPLDVNVIGRIKPLPPKGQILKETQAGTVEGSERLSQIKPPALSGRTLLEDELTGNVYLVENAYPPKDVRTIPPADPEHKIHEFIESVIGPGIAAARTKFNEAVDKSAVELSEMVNKNKQGVTRMSVFDLLFNELIEDVSKGAKVCLNPDGTFTIFGDERNHDLTFYYHKNRWVFDHKVSYTPTPLMPNINVEKDQLNAIFRKSANYLRDALNNGKLTRELLKNAILFEGFDKEAYFKQMAEHHSGPYDCFRLNYMSHSVVFSERIDIGRWIVQIKHIDMTNWEGTTAVFADEILPLTQPVTIQTFKEILEGCVKAAANEPPSDLMPKFFTAQIFINKIGSPDLVSIEVL